jgi:hypothetical protein
MNKTELLQAIQTGRAELDALLAQLNDEQMSDPALDGGRSVKDVLAHIAVWERRCARWFETTLDGGIPQRPEPGVTWGQIDELNEYDFLRTRDSLLQEVLVDERRFYQQLLDLVKSLPEEDFGENHRFSWWEGEPIGAVIASNSYEHYQEHIEQIEAWLAKA